MHLDKNEPNEWKAALVICGIFLSIPVALFLASFL